MTPAQKAEVLRTKINEVKESFKSENKNDRIVMCHVQSDLFLKMAELYIAKYGE